MNNHSALRLLALSSVASAALMSGAVFAQTAAADPATNADIVVTAQFRSQKLQDTPLAISAVNAESMEARSQTSILDVARSAPSVNIEKSGSGGGLSSAITIRGIGQTDFLPALDPGVGIYIDDIYYGVMFGSTFDLLDLDRVEILRGPQGTLSGKNSIGGSVKLFSKEPTFDSEGSVQLTYGSFDKIEARGVINIPIVKDRVAVRISGLVRNQGGYLDVLDYGCAHPGTIKSVGGSPQSGCKIGEEGGQNLSSIRGAIKVKWSDSVEQLLSADKIRDIQDPTPAQLLTQPAFFPYDFKTPKGSYFNYDSFVNYLGTAKEFRGDPKNTALQWGLSNRFGIDIGDSLKLDLITGFRKTSARTAQDGDVSPVDTYQQLFRFTNKQFTQEVRLSGQVGDFADWTVGGFYFHSKATMGGRVIIPAAGLDFVNGDRSKSESKSGFAHTSLHLSERANLTLGLRYTDESKDYRFGRLGPDGGPPNPAVASLNGAGGRYSGAKWDYRIAVDYRWSDQLLTYAQFATGFKGGGISARPYFASQALTFQPEEVKTYEAGFKSDFFDRRLRFNATGFYTEYSNMQLITTNCAGISSLPVGERAPCTLTVNAGASKLWGAELEMTARPIDGLLIDASASFLDFKYTKVDTVGTGIKKGFSNPFMPKTKINIGIQYEIAAPGGSITPRVDYAYHSGYETESVPFTPSYGHVDGYGLWNARLTYKTDDGDWEGSLAVTNVGDKFYYANKFDRSGPPFFVATGYIGRPREWSVSVKRKF